MLAVLLATGETKKLRPLTETIPSPMIPVMNRPVMAYNLELLGRLEFKRIVVSLCHHAYQIENYFGNGRKWGVSLEYVLQPDNLGTAGALYWARRILNETFIVLPADEVVHLDLSQAIQQHLDRQAVATVIVRPISDENDRELFLDGDQKVIMQDMIPSAGVVSSWVDTGIYLFDPCVLGFIPSRGPSDIHQILLPALIRSGHAVWASQAEGYWNPLTTFRNYAAAQRLFLSEAIRDNPMEEGNIVYRYTTVESREITQGIFTGRHTRIHPSTQLKPPVSIGSNSWIGRKVELGPNTIIGSNVVIDDEATVYQSTVLDHTYVGKLVNLENRLVNKNLLVDLRSEEQVQVSENFLLGEVNPELVISRIRRFQDFFISALILLLTFPFILCLCLLVWLSTGSVFKRVPYCTFETGSSDKTAGQSKIYTMLHFNTSKSHKQPGRFGKWLLSWDGHRLPELINVLKGELRLVGLRPICFNGPISADMLSKQLASHGSPAGFSGLWYVQSDGEINLLGDHIEEALIIDKYYSVTRNWRQDLWLLWRTPAAWYRRVQRNAT